MYTCYLVTRYGPQVSCQRKWLKDLKKNTPTRKFYSRSGMKAEAARWMMLLDISAFSNTMLQPDMQFVSVIVAAARVKTREQIHLSGWVRPTIRNILLFISDHELFTRMEGIGTQKNRG